MSRLVIRLELPTKPSGRIEAAEHPVDLGLLAPSLSPEEIGKEVLSWANQSTNQLMNRLREKEMQS